MTDYSVRTSHRPGPPQDPPPLRAEDAPVPQGTLNQSHLASIPRGPEQQQNTPALPAGWTRVRRAVVNQSHVRSLLEPAMTTASPVLDTDAEASPPEDPVWLSSNGWPPTALSMGAPRPGELEELERHIAGTRARLHQALLRREELLAQLQSSTLDPSLRQLHGYTVATDTAPVE